MFYMVIHVACDQEQMMSRTSTHALAPYHGICKEIVIPYWDKTREKFHKSVVNSVDFAGDKLVVTVLQSKETANKLVKELAASGINAWGKMLEKATEVRADKVANDEHIHPVEPDLKTDNVVTSMESDLTQEAIIDEASRSGALSEVVSTSEHLPTAEPTIAKSTSSAFTNHSIIEKKIAVEDDAVAAIPLAVVQKSNSGTSFPNVDARQEQKTFGANADYIAYTDQSVELDHKNLLSSVSNSSDHEQPNGDMEHAGSIIQDDASDLLTASYVVDKANPVKSGSPSKQEILHDLPMASQSNSIPSFSAESAVRIQGDIPGEQSLPNLSLSIPTPVHDASESDQIQAPHTPDPASAHPVDVTERDQMENVHVESPIPVIDTTHSPTAEQLKDRQERPLIPGIDTTHTPIAANLDKPFEDTEISALLPGIQPPQALRFGNLQDSGNDASITREDGHLATASDSAAHPASNFPQSPPSEAPHTFEPKGDSSEHELP